MTALDSGYMSQTEFPTATRVEVPLSTYRILEQRIRDVRLSVLRSAARMALEEAPAQPPGRVQVSQADIEAALKRVASLPELEHDEAVQLPKVPNQTYSWLERRLDALRSLVIHVATRLAKGEAAGAPAENYMTLNAAMMGRAWQDVWGNQPMRSSALIKN
jgi:hypothetical protein